MKLLAHILRYEWKSLWRSNILVILLLVVLGAGTYGIYFGKYEIEKQQARIAQVQQHERQQFDSLLHWSTLDTAYETNQEKYLQAVSPSGVGWSKHFTYYFTHEAPPLAGLCIGQRDLFPVYYGFNVTDLARQVNVGELANPMKLLTGNFDLSYVFVFLIPLLIVALFYDLYAHEKEGGTLALLQAQPVSLTTILISKGLLRLLIVVVTVTVLLLLGFILQGISLSQQFGLFVSWLLVMYAYCLLWTLFMGVVINLKRSAALSAMIGLGVWLIFALITPALLNLFVSAQAPPPNRAEVIHAVRTLNDQVWESPKSFVFERVYHENPDFYTADTADFDQWYYASFTLLDNKANALKQQFEEQVAKRNQLLNHWQWLAPAAMVHEKLSNLSKTDRQSHQEFINELYIYHQELKELYYQRIFAKENFSRQDLEKLSERL
jgi:ABC-2 type transport system permease protein